MTQTTQDQSSAQNLPVSLWRSALLGPMPLAYPLIAACVFYYLFGVLLSLVMGGFDLKALPTLLWSPADTIQVALGNGGRAPLLVWHVWTLINASFLHLNIPHIAVNMLCLYQIMPAVERGFGRPRAFCIYILAGIAGSLASAFWGEYYSLGASGALFGLFGAVLVYGLLRRDDYGRYLIRFSLQWAGINFAFGLFGPIAVSNAAHAGGFIGGALAALAVIYRINPRGTSDPWQLAFVLFGLTVACLSIGIGRATFVTWQALADPVAFQARESDDILAKTNAMLALKPDDARALLERSDIEARKGDYIAALADANAAIAAGMDTPGLHHFKAYLLARAGRPAEALPEVEIALRANPNDAEALNLRAYLYVVLGDHDKAIADYRAVLRIDPDDQQSRLGLEKLTGAR